MKAFLVAVGLAIASPSFAQDGPRPCAPRDVAFRMLTEVHGEELIGQGLADSGEYIVEVFVNPSTGGWTAIATTPNGTSCMLESGTGWSAPAKKAKGRGA